MILIIRYGRGAENAPSTPTPRRTVLEPAALALASAFLLTACGGTAQPAANTDGSASAAATDRTLDVIGPYEVHSIDPETAEGIFTRLQVAETLVEAGPTGELLPGLATEWNASVKFQSSPSLISTTVDVLPPRLA